MWSRTSPSNFHYPVFTLRSSANCLRLRPHLPVTYNLSFSNMFQKAVPTQDVTNPVSLPSFYCFKIFLSSLTLCYTLCFSQEKSKWASQSFSTTTFPGISEILPEIFTFQHHTKLCSKCSNLLFSPLYLSPICWWKRPSSFGCYFYHGNPNIH